MSNMGFIRFVKNGMRFEAAKVGDRYVLETMRQNDYNFGGDKAVMLFS